jgi:Protein of unknown function (DUF3579)
MHAATQKRQGTILSLTGAAPLAVAPSRLRVAPGGVTASAADSMPAATPRLFKIQGITREGKAFRPSDWAERLAGALSSFRPAGGIDAHIGYSPYCVPRVVGGVKCVIVNEALRALEPMALDFVMNFARDNNLVIHEIAPGDDLR